MLSSSFHQKNHLRVDLDPQSPITSKRREKKASLSTTNIASPISTLNEMLDCYVINYINKVLRDLLTRFFIQKDNRGHLHEKNYTELIQKKPCFGGAKHIVGAKGEVFPRCSLIGFTNVVVAVTLARGRGQKTSSHKGRSSDLLTIRKKTDAGAIYPTMGRRDAAPPKAALGSLLASSAISTTDSTWSVVTPIGAARSGSWCERTARPRCTTTTPSSG